MSNKPEKYQELWNGHAMYLGIMIYKSIRASLKPNLPRIFIEKINRQSFIQFYPLSSLIQA